MNASDLIDFIKGCNKYSKIKITYGNYNSIIFRKDGLTNIYYKGRNTVVLEFERVNRCELLNTGKITHIRCEDYTNFNSEDLSENTVTAGEN